MSHHSVTSLQIEDVILQNDVAGPSDVVFSTDTSGLSYPFNFIYLLQCAHYYSSTYDGCYNFQPHQVPESLKNLKGGKNLIYKALNFNQPKGLPQQGSLDFELLFIPSWNKHLLHKF